MTSTENVPALHSGARTRRTTAPAFAILLALAAFSSFAQAQTLTVLYSFTGGANGNLPLQACSATQPATSTAGLSVVATSLAPTARVAESCSSWM